MTTRDYTANVISATKVVPDGNFKTSAASGVWDINEALDLIKGGNWPNAANIDPASFVDALFSTDLWTSDGSSAQTITNNIDLSNKGGLVWIKDRSTSKANVLVDTARISGTTDNYLMSDSANGQTTHSNEFGDFTSTGYTIPRNTEAGYTNTNTGRDYVGWTFRKQPKFFDIQTWSGNGVNGRTISHNLGSVPGMIIVKRLDSTDGWITYHRGMDASSPEDYAMFLNLTNARATETYWNNTAPTSTGFTVSSNVKLNGSSGTYVAYLFAHNNDDGGFGEPGDQDIIKCGTFATDSSGNATVTLGFEPQFVMNKVYDAADNWTVADNMRGFTADGDQRLYWNLTNIEAAATTFRVTSTGFTVNSGETSKNYIYMAIRRGGMQTPTAASDVFAIDTGDGDHNASFPIDFTLTKRRVSGASNYIMSRLLGDSYLVTNSTSVLGSFNFDNLFDDMTGVDFRGGSGWYDTSDTIGWMWKRARGYFDVVVYEGPSGTGNISHNLGVVPEMIWVKNTGSAENWAVYHKDLGNTYYLHLNTNAAASNTDGGNFWNSTTPTASVFSVGTSTLTSHYTRNHAAYLFATVAGVSKVGSFSHTNGSTTDVDCGFTGDTPSFVLLKRYSDTGSWIVFDSTRGIVAGNDPFLDLDTTDAEATGNDVIDPLSGGFQVASGYLATGDWIFYAIA